MTQYTIICVGSSVEIFNGLKEYFSKETYSFIFYATAEKLIKDLIKLKVSLIFLNNQLPDFNNSQELCIAIRSIPSSETVPLIILAPEQNQQEKIKLFNSGLIDGYLCEPFSIEELAAYANAFLLRQSLQEQLEEKNQLLAQMSVTDDLTQVFNRRYLIIRLDDEIKRIKRYNYTLSVLMVDIDHFKEINDNFGHLTGDLVLKSMAGIFRENLRSVDIICRYGGEEFVILLPHIAHERANLIAERIRTKVKSNNFIPDYPNHRITVSIGMVSYESTSKMAIDTILHQLDMKLYEAKNSGRDKICSLLIR